ncbi:MAG TPA: PAS domain S-box protein, partial [Thermoanaerobaculia bacterium]|nr:PAS domain S-box protein [Thermoanaerobaculia bacterium]
MPEIQSLFDPSGYAAAPLTIASAIAATVIFLLGLTIFVRGRASLASALFFTITLASAGWLGSFALMYATHRADIALTWARLGHFFASLIPAAVFHFACEYVGRRRTFRAAAALFWVACAVVSILSLTTSLVIPTVRHFVFGFYPVGNSFGGMLVLSYAAILAVSVYLFRRAVHAAEGMARERAGALMLAFLLASLALLDYLPAVGIEIYPVGYMSMLIFAVIAASALWRYQLIDITPAYAASQILETMKGAVVVVDMVGKIRVVNRAACALLGYRASELLNAHIRTILEPDANMSTGQLLNSMGVLEQNMVWRSADGSRIDILASSSFVRNSDNAPVGVIYVASDFTERKRAEQALRESEHRYRTLFETNPLPMWVYDFETLQFVAVNDAAVRHYGWSRDELLRMHITDIRPAEEIPRVMALLPNLEGRGGPGTFRHRKKNGSIIDVEVTSFEFLSGRRRMRLVIAQDITERKRAEDELRQSEERYRELFENANDLVYTHDLEMRFTSMNLAGERITGYSREELLGNSIAMLVAPDDLERGREQFRRKLRGETAATFYEIDILGKDGRRVPVELGTRLIYRDGKPVGVQGIGRDVTERKANEARFRLLFERNLAGVYRSRIDGTILDCNDACARIFGFESRDAFIKETAFSVYFDRNDRELMIALLQEQKSVTNVEQRMRRRDGTVVWVLENASMLESEPGIMEGTLIDVTDRKYAQEQMEYQAYHDILTGLPNRLLFRDRINMALAQAKRHDRCVAVMFLDLDQFKLVNDTLGHTVGDRLLQAIGARLVGCVRLEDTVARMGGDEFTILLSDINDRKSVAIVAQKILEAVREPVDIDEHELFVTTSIGIANFPEDGHDAEMLLKNADRAMYRAKDAGRNNFQYSTPSNFDGDGRLALERSLHHAFEREEFVVHYQPMVEIATGRVVGAEALVRWEHPQNGMMQPDDFIPIAEDCQLIIPLGEWVLRTACRQMKAWHDAGHAWLRVAVNLSPRQFQQRDLFGMIERVLVETGFPPTYLDLEITESTAMQNVELSLSLLRRLKDMGVRISIDDFGTGYSSLSYLKRFPIDTVKIDQDFVRDLTTGSSDSAI